MPDLLCDIANPRQLSQYPAHGWAVSSQNLRLLWLPVVRIVRCASDVRSSRGLPPLTVAQMNEVHAFRQTVEKLALSLRELHKAVTFVQRCGGIDGPVRDDYRVEALIPVFVDSVYSYVRRLADRLANALRFLLFQHAESAPRQYSKLRALLSDPERLKNLVPLFDLAHLRSAIVVHSGWFDLVRDSELADGVHRKGIRDALEHHPVIVSVARSKNGDEPWEVAAFMRSPSHVNTELLTPIRTIMQDLCALFAGVVATVDAAGNYVVSFNGDAVFLTGRDADSTGFWPPLAADA